MNISNNIDSVENVTITGMLEANMNHTAAVSHVFKLLHSLGLSPETHARNIKVGNVFVKVLFDGGKANAGIERCAAFLTDYPEMVIVLVGEKPVKASLDRLKKMIDVVNSTGNYKATLIENNYVELVKYFTGE